MDHFNRATRRILVIVTAACFLTTAGEAQQIKWMTVGSFQSWYSSTGCEIEEGRAYEQQDGDRWPALYQKQDNVASKGFWIGTTNYKDNDGKTYPHKVVHVGPRIKGQGEFFPTKFTMAGKFAPSVVSVGGVAVPAESLDGIDASLKADRVIENIINTSIGMSIVRKILGFSKKGHEDYLIYEYTFTNSAKVDSAGAKRDTVTLTGVYFYWQFRYAVNADVRFNIGNPTGWGQNTMYHSVGDTAIPSTFFPASPFNADNSIRALYAWHGKYSNFQDGYDNIGGPIFIPYLAHGFEYQKGDTVGRLGGSAFIGVATLYAQKSPTDASDDSRQPATTCYVDVDDPNNGTDVNQQFNAAKMDAQYAWMVKGHLIPRHADKVGYTGNPSAGSLSPGGFSSAVGYGPYTLAPGQSIKIVMAEAAGGLSREANIHIGRAYKHTSPSARDTALITYNGVRKTKNDWVYTGRDSLFKTFKAAMANYASGYSLGADVPPAPGSFSVNSGTGGINLLWTKIAEDAKTVNYQVWRAAGQYDSTYYKQWEGAGAAFSDTTASVDAPYYYYVVGVDASGNVSNRLYAQTYNPVYKRAGITTVEGLSGKPGTFALGQNFPNPFNPATTISFRIASRSFVSLRVFDVMGREVAAIASEELPAGTYTRQWIATGYPTGVYFYRLQAGAYTETRRLLLLK